MSFTDESTRDRWHLPFAILMTLLFGLFVVLYARLRVESQASTDPSQSSVSESQSETVAETSNSPAGLPADAAFDPFHTYRQLNELIEWHSLEMAFDRENQMIRVVVKDLFGPGQAVVAEDLHPLLNKLGEILAKNRLPIRIEGHADAAEERVVGYSGAKYASTWDLSAARAAWVARHLLAKYQLDPQRVSIGGAAHYKPIRKTDDRQARAANRRIEFMILGDPKMSRDANSFRGP